MARVPAVVALSRPTFEIDTLVKNRVPVFVPPTNLPKTQAVTLASIYLKVVAVWTAGTENLLAAYTPQITDSPADNDAVLETLEQEIRVLIASIGVELRNWAVRAEEWHRGAWASNVYSATNVQLGTVLTGTVVEETVEAFIRRNVALAKDVSAEAQRRIADAIYRGYQQRLSVDVIAKEIRKATQMAKGRSIRIAGDQNSKLSAALDKERQLEAGFKFGRYRHSGKKHPRAWHKARDEKIYDLKTLKQIDPTTLKPLPKGDKIMPEDQPGFPPFCGCRMGAWLPISRDL